MELEHQIDPRTTAVITFELQRGLVGDLGGDTPLTEAVHARGLLARVADVVTAARRAGAPVVHCVAAFRPDRVGSFVNTPMIEANTADPTFLAVGSPSAAVVPELGPQPGDVEVVHLNGFTPFTGTVMDTTLRSLGVRTIIPVGVTLNAGIIGACLEGVALGYRVVVPEDAVVGLPPAYGDEVLRHSIPWLATVCTTSQLVASWDPGRIGR